MVVAVVGVGVGNQMEIFPIDFVLNGEKNKKKWNEIMKRKKERKKIRIKGTSIKIPFALGRRGKFAWGIFGNGSIFGMWFGEKLLCWVEEKKLDWKGWL